MEINNVEQVKNLLNKIKNNEEIINCLIEHLESNNLLEDLYSKTYLKIETCEPKHKIKYNKNEGNIKHFNLNKIKHYFNIFKMVLEDYIAYDYNEIRTIYFNGKIINKKIFGKQEYFESFGNSFEVVYNIRTKEEIIKIIKDYPLFFINIVLEYNVDMESLSKSKQKKHVYTKEIKNN